MTRKIVTDKLNTNHFLESSYSLCEDAVDAKRLHEKSTEGKRETDTQKKRRYLSMKKKTFNYTKGKRKLHKRYLYKIVDTICMILSH